MDKDLCRCPWAENDPLLEAYHDKFWGRPVHDDRELFRMLNLEAMQAGLSWLTVLKKEENFDRAFDNFDPEIVAEYDEEKIEELMKDSGIIRNSRKIRAVVTNAQAFKEVVEEFGSFSAYLWDFVGGRPIINSWEDPSQVPAKTDLSEKISKDLKKRGFAFVGPTTIYSFIQAVGLVNDHLVNCDFR